MNVSFSYNSFWIGLSLVFALLMVGLFGIASFHSSRLGAKLKEQLNVVVEFTKNYTETQKSQLFEELNNHEAILDGSLNFYTKAEALELMGEEFDSEFFSQLDELPFHDMVTFRLHDAYYEPTKLKQLKQHLQSREYITDVVYQEEHTDLIEQNVKKMSLVPMLLALLLTTLSIALMVSTIRFNLQKDDSKIKTMKLVGADKYFIQKPYTKAAIRIGFTSAIIAIAILMLIIRFLRSALGEFSELIHYPYVLVMSIVLMLLGMLVPYLASRTIISDYLTKMRLDI